MNRKIGVLLFLQLVAILCSVAVTFAFVKYRSIKYDSLTEVIITSRTWRKDYSYGLTNENGAWIAVDYSDMNECRKRAVDEAFANRVKKILSDYQVHTWDGFEGSDNIITSYGNGSYSYNDYYGFYMALDDDTTINAGGYVICPRHFDKVLDALIELFAPLFSE